MEFEITVMVVDRHVARHIRSAAVPRHRRYAVKLPLIGALLSLSFAKTAQGAPITLEFHGVIDSVASSVSLHVAPSLAVGDLFTPAVTFRDDGAPASSVDIALGSSIGGTAICALCFASTLNTGAERTIGVMPSTIFGPPTTWSPGGPIQQSL